VQQLILRKNYLEGAIATREQKILKRTTVTKEHNGSKIGGQE